MKFNKHFIMYLTFFALGFYISLSLAAFGGIGVGKTSIKVVDSSEAPLNLAQFWEVYGIVQSDFYSDESVKNEDLVSGAIHGMVEALGDQHSEYMSPEVTEKFEASLSGDFEGIGAVVEKVPLGVKVERIIKGSPAKAYDIRADDIIISANETDLADLDIYDAIDYIKGPAGTQVSLEILRPGEESIITKEVTRAKIQIPSVELEFFEEEEIAYIALNMFGEHTASEFISSLEQVKNSNSQGLIIDLRDNGGGYLQSAVEILSEFIPEGEVLVKTKYTNSFFNENYYSFSDGEEFDQKIVILINENSASASEITAGALSDYDAAILVGQQSYGKGSVQQPFTMEDGSLLKLTVARWFTPKGKSIEEEGIHPDIEIEFLEEDYENKYDRQLEEAKKILQIYKEKETIGLTIEAYLESQEEDEEDTSEE